MCTKEFSMQEATSKSIIDKDVKASLEQLEKYETANRDEAFQRAKLAYDV